jgi:drug/metabolite transporter (DMT)-like permease
MFCFNYWLVYIAESKLTSGLVAILFSTMIFMNALNNRIFLKAPIEPRIIIGGVIGLLGLGLIFLKELSSVSLGSDAVAAIGLCLLASLSASLGNTVAQVCHRRQIPIVPMELYAMAYGTAVMGVVAVVRGVTFTFDTRFEYAVSLAYLAVAGSVIAFLSYLTLLKNIGSDRTAYITLATPVVALALSTLFEGYTWSLVAALGVLAIMAGNWVALKK